MTEQDELKHIIAYRLHHLRKDLITSQKLVELASVAKNCAALTHANFAVELANEAISHLEAAQQSAQAGEDAGRTTALYEEAEQEHAGCGENIEEAFNELIKAVSSI
jgi:hypothetical protein